MRLTLTTDTQHRLSTAVRALVSPLDHRTVDEWRSDVNRKMKRLLGADMASFLLPVERGLKLYSEEYSPDTLRAYPDREPRLPGDLSMWQRQVNLVVFSRSSVYSPYLKEYLRSEYYNDYVVPVRAHDSVGITIPLCEQPDATRIAGLLFHHERPDRRRFGERGMALLRLALPAFRAGVNAYVRLAQDRESLARTLDDLGHALLIADSAGRVIHQNSALVRILAEDPEGQRLAGEMHGIARSLAANEVAEGWIEPSRPVAQEVMTGLARYRLHGSRFSAGLSGAGSLFLVSIDRLTPRPVSDDSMKERFGLTKAEIRVARLLAEGESNAVIAATLTISPHTAERHTERVLQKLGIHSRAAVGSILLRS